MVRYSFTWSSFMLRLGFAALLVFASYNPSSYNFYRWVANSWPQYSVPMIFIGVVLLIGWTIFIRATLRSLGILGLVLACAFFGTLIWLIIDWGLVAPDNVTAMTYLALALLSGVLGVGMSWSHIRRRLSGQADMDDVDE